MTRGYGQAGGGGRVGVCDAPKVAEGVRVACGSAVLVSAVKVAVKVALASDVDVAV
jgi:hypothetical protein